MPAAPRLSWGTWGVAISLSVQPDQLRTAFVNESEVGPVRVHLSDDRDGVAPLPNEVANRGYTLGDGATLAQMHLQTLARFQPAQTGQ
jgi:hypothetical protein